ncbi:MAG: hypothetical protein CME62_07305 [Halobacteriovoraceae bacterium]|nr:hypothetical protein [Halobacteriovoraceae bacterium]
MARISYYDDYISRNLYGEIQKDLKSIEDVPGLSILNSPSGIENSESMAFLCEVYELVKPELINVLNQRKLDRQFIDQRTKTYYQFNQENNIDLLDQNYKTVLGDEDDRGRKVMGPLLSQYYKATNAPKVAAIPDYLNDFHVTLFGPPDDAKLSINAMNAYHRKLKDEPQIISEILEDNQFIPKWGADDEDSKTPMHEDLVAAAENLKGCFNQDITFHDEKRSKTYELADSFLSRPIKRFPGLALPCNFLFYHNEPIPLHLYDFCLHLFEHWHNPEALCFYVPKLENEEEARYIKNMIKASESLIKNIHPEYNVGTVRVIIVLENPRAVFRVNEIIDELYPYFVGASLGWHDYLGSTARLFKEDGNYRIPVKADPDIVIKYIKASHELLAHVVGERGGIKIGGMYGILPITNELHSESFQITLRGYFRDVITQLKRNLSGFWVAHPDFVRIGLALVCAWKKYEKGEEHQLNSLIESLLNENYAQEIKDFVKAQDIQGLDHTDPGFARSLIVADIKESEFIANNDPEEIRYNVFQMLQYLCDWLSGNGCVALPTQINDIPARVMDDLATAERSRWEVWHEIHHGRFDYQDFIKIAHEEMNFIRRDLSNDKKIVQVKYSQANAKWYEAAFQLMLQLMTGAEPVEFATELLLPFTLQTVREKEKPWDYLHQLEPQKYSIEDHIAIYHYYFEMCGSQKFAFDNKANITGDLDLIKNSIMSFSMSDILSAASFHGDIGQNAKSLDALAKTEQSLISEESQLIKDELIELGEKYKQKFGMKFLVSAQGKSASELKEILVARLNSTLEQEVENAKLALYEITKKRVEGHPLNGLKKKLNNIFSKANIKGAQLSISYGFDAIQNIQFGESKQDTPTSSDSLFQIASLSKTMGTMFALEVFKELDISVDTPVNFLLNKLQSPFRLDSNQDEAWGNAVTLRHLMQHTALNMHYVDGIKPDDFYSEIHELVHNPERFHYQKFDTIHKPGSQFQYSGAGFVVLEYIIKLILKDDFYPKSHEFFRLLNSKFSFQDPKSELKAHGHLNGEIKNKQAYLEFPCFAAGMWGSTNDVLQILAAMTVAHHKLEGFGPLSHDTAVNMSFGVDLGAQEFMGANIGLGVFIIEAGENRFYLHQGANDGFRAIYLYCFDGPDLGKGLSILANDELNAVYMIAEMAKAIFSELKITGVDFSKLPTEFSAKNLKSEEIVNIGYKELLLKAFKQTQPEAIVKSQEKYPLGEYNLLRDAEVIRVSNEKFARIENLISIHEPVFDPKEFGRQGKIMDSWESARHNQNEYEYARFRMHQKDLIRFVHLSTKFHDGNQVEEVEILGDGQVILPKTKLAAHCFLNIDLENSFGPFKEVEIRVYPDGGLTRVALLTRLPKELSHEFKPLADAKPERYKLIIPAVTKPMAIDFNLDELGMELSSVSDEHYAGAKNVLSPYAPINMFDGFETKRSRNKENFEYFEVSFKTPKAFSHIYFDFTYFRNNAPMWIEVEEEHAGEFHKIDRFFAKPFAGNKCIRKLKEKTSPKKVRFKLFPDGGINRVKFLE